jgi:hypothetical protein
LSHEDALLLQQTRLQQAQLQQALSEEIAHIESAVLEMLARAQHLEAELLAVKEAEIALSQGAEMGADEIATLEHLAYLEGVAAFEAEIAATHELELATLKEIELLTAGLSEEELAYWEQLELQAQADAEAAGVA